MENLLHKCKIFASLCYILLSPFLSLSLLLPDYSYTWPDHYFINCGSHTNTTLNHTGRTFIGDGSSGSFGFSTSDGTEDKDTNSSTNPNSLYQTARVFRKLSWYDFEIVQNGTYVVRLHFFPFSSQSRLSDAHFDVLASGFSLLSNFSIRNISNNQPIIQEFLLSVAVGKFKIQFKPYQESSFAFVNAIEVFLAPENFIPDAAPHVSLAGKIGEFNGLLSHALHIAYRINVGGEKITVENDTMGRNWVPDDDYIYYKEAARNSPFYSDSLSYQTGGATNYFAPDLVYKTAKELNISSSRELIFFNITWQFGVKNNAKYLIRAHFCDIISTAINVLQFNFYINRKFGVKIDPYKVYTESAAPFYRDFLVESDYSDFINISIGPHTDSIMQTAFLNGLEIMELRENLGLDPGESKPKNKKLYIIIGSLVGGLSVFFILLSLVWLHFKRRRVMTVKNLDLYGGTSHGRISGESNKGTPVHKLNLGLKIPWGELLYATNNFDSKLMVGEGGFGKVYRGTLRDGHKVAVKRSEPGHGQGRPEFQTEIIVLSKIRHRHLVSLIGYCDEGSEMILVYEFMEKGTLRDHLYKLNQDSNKSPLQPNLSWNQRLEICIGAAKGLHYLHTGSDGGIIHRDVKSTNILLDENYVAKVADFGLSRSGHLDQTHVSTNVKGSFGYLDPEYYKWMQLTQKSDVYSFGVVLLEVLCARPAINTSLPMEQVNLADWGLSFLKQGKLEEITDPSLVGAINPNSLRKFGETVEKCLKESGVERPSMVDVLWNLEYALQLQKIPVLREPHEDSTSDVSWKLPLPIVRRLPSHSMPTDEDEQPLNQNEEDSHTDYINASLVFSQLKMDNAR